MAVHSMENPMDRLQSMGSQKSQVTERLKQQQTFKTI